MPVPGGKRLVKSKSGLKIVCQHDREASPWDLAEPHWTADNEALNCFGCNCKFDFLKRRHHCRRCGQIFCNSCCSARVQFHRMGFVDPVRLCGQCAEVTKVEDDFFTNYIKVLFDGAPFHVTTSKTPSPLSTPDTPPSSMTESSSAGSLGTSVPKLFYCKLTPDQRFLIFHEHEDNESIELREPLEVAKILDITDDKQQVGSLGIKVMLNVAEEMSLTLDSPPEPSRKPSLLWLEALQKGLAMLMENKDDETAPECLES